MNGLVCFKIVPDLDQLSQNDWSVDEDLQVDTGFVKTMVNPYDESALELALKLRDEALSRSSDLTLTALTVGGQSSDRTLKNLMALNYARGVRISAQEELRFQPENVAASICQYIRNHPSIDVIVMGSQSGVGDNGKTPFLVAESLGLPCIPSVTGIRMSEQENCLNVTASYCELELLQTISLPAVLVIGNVAGSYLRVPTLKSKMEAAKKNIEILSPEPPVAQDNIELQLIDLFYENQIRNCEFLQEDTPAKTAGLLYEKYIKEKIK